jgi:hypothetical protein
MRRLTISLPILVLMLAIAAPALAGEYATPATAGSLLTFLDNNPHYKGKYWDDWSLLNQAQRHEEIIKVFDIIAPIVKTHMNDDCRAYFYAPGEDDEQASKSIALVAAISSVDPGVRDAWMALILEINKSWWSRIKWYWGGKRKVMKKFRQVCKSEGSTVEGAVLAILPGPVGI